MSGRMVRREILRHKASLPLGNGLGMKQRPLTFLGDLMDEEPDRAEPTWSEPRKDYSILICLHCDRQIGVDLNPKNWGYFHTDTGKVECA